jgi:Ca-activated chloride channel family protein
MIRFALLPALFLPVVLGLLSYLLGPRRERVRSQAFTGPFDVQAGMSGTSTIPPGLLIWLGIILLSVALARPQSGFERLPDAGEGVDIILTLDVSTSMLEEDYSPSRLQAARDAALRFVEGRPTDRIGLVVYAAEPLALCPPTLDHATLERYVSKASLGNLQDGTAIGAGLAVAARGLEYSQTARRVIILLSDGMENAGIVNPIDVARAIRTLHGDSLRVYTVAIGTEGSEYGVDVATLSEIAQTTGGRLFDAASPAELASVYGAIDSLEASTLPPEGLFVYKDHYFWFLLVGLFLVLAGGMVQWGTMKVAGD